MANPTPAQKIDITQWRSNQRILMLIENCQDGQISMRECQTDIPTIFDQCKLSHVLACDDDRLVGLLNAAHAKIGID